MNSKLCLRQAENLGLLPETLPCKTSQMLKGIIK